MDHSDRPVAVPILDNQPQTDQQKDWTDTLHSEQACPPRDAEKHLDEQNLLWRPAARTSQPEVARTVCMLDLVATGAAGKEAAASAGFLRL